MIVRRYKPEKVRSAKEVHRTRVRSAKEVLRGKPGKESLEMSPDRTGGLFPRKRFECRPSYAYVRTSWLEMPTLYFVFR